MKKKEYQDFIWFTLYKGTEMLDGDMGHAILALIHNQGILYHQLTRIENLLNKKKTVTTASEAN